MNSKRKAVIFLILGSFLLICSGTQGFTALQATANLVYSTDFESATIGYGSWNLDGVDPLSTYISMGDGRGRQWIEGLDEVTTDLVMEGNQQFLQMPGSTRCIGGEQADASMARSEMAIYPAGGGGDNPASQLVGDEFFIRFWRLLPTDWALNSPINRWSILLQVSDVIPPANCPFLGWFVFENPSPDFPDLPVGEKWAVLQGRDENLQPISPLAIYKNFDLPLGRWFKVEWYMFRHPVDGVIKCWVDGVLIFDVSGIKTKSVDYYEIGIAKIYYDSSDDTRHRTWIDNLEIWDSLPNIFNPVVSEPNQTVNGISPNQTENGDHQVSDEQSPSSWASYMWDGLFWGSGLCIGVAVVYLGKSKSH